MRAVKLFFSSILLLLSSSSCSFNNDLRHTLMFLAEPLIHGESINGGKLDGSHIETVVPFLDKTMEKTLGKYEGEDFEKLKSFREVFRIGFDIFIMLSAENKLTIQEYIKKQLDERPREWIYIPTTWSGTDPHAIVIGLRKNLSNNYDLAVINSGDGTKFHYSEQDPNGIYPHVTQLWLDFKYIPSSELFDENAWFIEGLQRIRRFDYAIKIGSLPTYFYGTILANLRSYKNRVSPTDRSLLIVTQRSGSCTMSSILAAILHHCQDRKLFFLYRLVMGQQILSEFLEKYETDEKFIFVLNNGLNVFGRKIISNIPSGLANFSAQYLEEFYPEAFKNSVLIGPGHSNWLFKKKSSAIETFSRDDFSLNLLKLTVDLGIKLHEVLKEAPFNPEFTTIRISELMRNSDLVKEIRGDAFIMGELGADMLDPYASFDVRIARPAGPSLLSLKGIIDSLRNCMDSKEFGDFNCVLDTFKRAGEKWWKIIENSESTDLINSVLELVELISRNYMSNQNKMRSFDNLVMLSCLQLAAWKAAQVQDKLMGNLIGLDRLAPPNLIQKFLSSDNVSSGNYFNHYIWTNFDAKNMNFLRGVIMELEKRNGKNTFAGPFEFGTKFIKTSFEYDEMNLNQENINMYARIKQIRAVQNILSRLNVNVRNKSSTGYAVILTEKRQLSGTIPHFYQLMNTLFYIYWGFQVGNRSPGTTNNFAFFHDQDSTFKICSLNTYFGYDSAGRYSRILGFGPEDYIRQLSLPNRSSIYVTLMSPKMNMFMYSRKIDAFEAFNQNLTIINLNTWLNYVKGALDSEIFAFPMFQFISDFLLNTPIINYGPNGHGLQNSHYLENFEPRHVTEIFDSLFALIKSDLKSLILKKKSSASNDKVKIVKKIVNMSILLTRFLERIENDKFIPGETIAKMLASLYSKLEPFGIIKRKDDLLDDSSISSFNLVLGYICYFDLRNSRSFFTQINENMKLNPEIPSFRRSLARMHLFLSKFTYMKHFDEEKSLESDLVEVGFPYKSVEVSEIPFLNELFKALFLYNYAPKALWETFNYCEKGVTAEAISRTGTKIAIHFAEGLIIVDDLLVAKKSIILQDPDFLKFVSGDSLSDFLKGEALRIGSNTVYAIENFKNQRSNLLFVKSDDINSRMRAFRQYNNNWYNFSPNRSDFTSLLHFNENQHFKDYNIYKRISKIPLTDNYIHDYVVLDFSNDLPLFRTKFETTGTRTSPKPIKITIRIGSSYVECDILRMGLVPDQFMFFEAAGVVGSCKLPDNRMVFIFPSLRFESDPKSPLVLVEKPLTEDGTAKFDLFNIPGYIVESDQTIDGNVSLKSTLRIRTQDGESQLLVPIIQRTRGDRVMANDFEIFNIEIVPIFNGKISPQTRFQKLLITFYALVYYEFDLALQLLHPNSSLHQNEVFTLEEFKLIQWIIHFESKTAESYALKSFILMHLTLNKMKFPLEYSKGGSACTDIINRISKKIENCSDLIIFDYMMSMRDLPEKYHLVKVFPEIRDRTIFQKMFQKLSKFSSTVTPLVPFAEHIELNSLPNAFYSGSYRANENRELTQNSSIEPQYLQSIFYDWFKRPEKQSELRHMTRFLEKQLETKVDRLLLNTSSTNMVVYCLTHDTSQIWNEFHQNIASNQDLIHNHHKGTNNNMGFLRALERCNSIYQNEFQVVSQNSGFDVNFDLIYNSMISIDEDDSDAREENTCAELNLISDADRNEVGRALEELETIFLNSRDFSNGAQQFINYTGDIKVVVKLKDSMDKYILKNGKSVEFKLESHNNQNLISLLEKLKTHLQLRIEMESERLKRLTNELMDRVVYDSGNETNSNIVLDYVIQLMHTKKSKVFKSLYSCYHQGNLKCFQKKFPQLSLDECRCLQGRADEFYKLSVLTQYFKFIADKIGDIVNPEGGTISIEELSILSDELSKLFDFEKRSMDKTILNFEFMSQKYRLKPEQVKDIFDRLTEIKDGFFTSTVIQRMMAAGKTLVLGTISVVKKAAVGDVLSILVPPSSLYQSNLSSMQMRTYSYFKVIGNTFHFPRFSAYLKASSGLEFMEYVLNLIKTTIKNRDYLILSPDSLHSFLNSYIEALRDFSQGSEEESDMKILQAFAEIYEIFQTKGSIILDEIDMTLDPRKEVNFPTVIREPYNIEAVTLMADLIEFSVFDDEIIANGLDIYRNNQAKLSPAQYENVKELLLTYIEKQLINESSIWYNLILEKIEIDNFTVAEIMDFFKNEDLDHKTSWIDDIIRSENRFIADALIIIKVELHNYLKESLKASSNLNYGFAGEKRANIHYAVPYLAANTPSPSSEFADRWETLNKTLLTFATTPCTRDIAASVLNYIVESIERESSDGIKPSSTATWINVTFMNPEIQNPLNLSKNNAHDVDIIFESLIKRSPAAIRILFDYCVDEIFLKMDFSTEQITSNALNMVSMFRSVQGYSGTIDNVNILPQEVIIDSYADHLNNEKHNGGIALKLLTDSSDAPVPELESKDFDRDLNSLLEKIFATFPESSDQIRAIIDAGAFFKNFTNAEIAKELLNVLGDAIRVVLYYNERSNQLEFVKKIGDTVETGYLSSTDPDSIKRSTHADVDNRFTFYDHRHITGSDIIQYKSAQAIITIGTRILLRDIFQGTLRMRQFMSRQRVHMLTSTAAREFYSSKVGPREITTVSDLLTLGALNEHEKQISENEKLAFVKIDNEIRRFVLAELTLIINNQEVKTNTKKGLIETMFKATRTLFIRSLQEYPRSWLNNSTEQESAQVLREYADSRVEMVRKVMDNPLFHALKDSEILLERFNALKTKLDNMISVEQNAGAYSLLTFLSPVIKRRQSDTLGNEVEMQLNTNVLAEIDFDSLVDCYNGEKSTINRYNYDISPLNTSLKHADFPDSPEIESSYFVSLFSILKDPLMQETYQPLTKNALLTNGKRVGASIDLVEVININGIEKRPFKIFSNYTREASHLLVQVLPEKKGVRVLLASTEMASYIHRRNELSKYKNDTPELFAGYWLCDLSGKVIMTNSYDNEIGRNILEFVPDSRELIFDALIFNASFNQIISSPYLKNLYYKFWLNSNKAVERAKFLVLRARVLFDKFTNTLSVSNQHFATLMRVYRGDLRALKNAEYEEEGSEAGKFQRPPINREIVTESFVSGSNVSTELESNSPFDLGDAFTKLIGPLRPFTSATKRLFLQDSRDVSLKPKSTKFESERRDVSQVNVLNHENNHKVSYPSIVMVSIAATVLVLSIFGYLYYLNRNDIEEEEVELSVQELDP